jgi:3-hexulose-6-phosphate synthase
MKLQISFELTDLDRAIAIAQEIGEFADIIEIGTLLLYTYGIPAIARFRQAVPARPLLIDTKIADRGKESSTLFATAEITWLTILAGTEKNVIHAAATMAHEHGILVMLDLIDAREYSQAALEAKNLGADALLLHTPYDTQTVLPLDRWELVRSNTELPIYIAGPITRENVDEVLKLKPDGIIIGSAITHAANPAQEAAFFAERCKN